MATAAVLRAEPALGNVIDALTAVALDVRRQFNALFVARHSASLLHVSGAVLAVCREIKNRRAMLDYDDLIGRAVALFESPGASWILYKLDGGIDHILVDEAQDTSPAQWTVIKAIAAEFFAGLGAERRGAAHCVNISSGSASTNYGCANIKDCIVMNGWTGGKLIGEMLVYDRRLVDAKSTAVSAAKT